MNGRYVTVTHGRPLLPTTMDRVSWQLVEGHATMITVTIKQADVSQRAWIQAIVQEYGFGELVEKDDALVAVRPNPIPPMEMANLELELIDEVGRHIAVIFERN